MMFRATPQPADLPFLEAALRERLAPLAADEPSGEAFANARGALISAAAVHASTLSQATGLRGWQRASVVSAAALAVPLAAGGALAAMPGSDLGAGPASVVSKVSGVFSGSGGDGGSTALLQEADDDGNNTEDDDTVTSLDNDNENDAENGDGVAATAGRGHEVCFEATATARARIAELLERDDISDEQREGLEHSLHAIENCGLGNDDEENGDELEAEEANEENGENGNGNRVCHGATAHAREVLSGLLGRVPEQGVRGVERALEAIENCGNGDANGEEENGDTNGTTTEGQSAGNGNRPAHAGPPEHAGPPDHAGPPENGNGSPGASGQGNRPDHAISPSDDSDSSGGNGRSNRSDHAGPPEDRGQSSSGSPGNSGSGGPPSNAGPGNSSQGGGPPEGRGRSR